MTKDDIMKLALESGWDAHHAAFDTRIEAFYNLVVAAEREACAKLCEDETEDVPLTVMADAIRERNQA